MSVRSPRGRPAATRWRVLERLAGATLVELVPHTGRTHQLRVHLASLGHPILGDPTYGARGRGRVRHPTVAVPRLALHAEQIRFRHPATGVPVSIRAAPPADFRETLAALRQVGMGPRQTPRSA
jgi:23S rRNA-/tRNA-specific pseudouridylate synthase